MRFAVVGVHVVHVVGGDYLHVVAFGPREQQLIGALLVAKAVPLYLDVVVCAKKIEVPPEQLLRPRLISPQDLLVDLAR